MTKLGQIAATVGLLFSHLTPASMAFAEGSPRRVATVSSRDRNEMRLAPFYQKILVDDGLIFASSEKGCDAALCEAAEIIDHMLARNAAVRQAIVDAKVRIVVMAPTEMTTEVPEHAHLTPRDYWDRRARGLGWSRQAPIVSCGEENLLAYPGDPYAAENILVHEFAHAVHSVGLAKLQPDFDADLRVAYNRAIERGLWKGTYAGSNHAEYWAEGSQTWFEANAPAGFVHNDIDTRREIKEYDPRLAELLEEVYGDVHWRYVRIDRRANQPPNRESLPRFAWPSRLADVNLESEVEDSQ